MSDLLQLHDWGFYLGMIVLFGFAPGFVLRVVLLLYPRGDDRRDELLAELYSLPRWKRPMWVAEQLETALFEGPKERMRNRGRLRRRKHGEAEPVRQDGPTPLDARKKPALTYGQMGDVASLFFAGLRSREIAEQLGIPQDMVERCLRYLRVKKARDVEALSTDVER